MQIKNAIIETLKAAYNTSSKKSLTFEELSETFEKLWGCNERVLQENKNETEIPEVGIQSHASSSTKKPRKKTIVEESARCFALKKDGGRCAAKAYTGGMNPKLCTLHNNKGANFGTFQESEANPEPALSPAESKKTLEQDQNMKQGSSKEQPISKKGKKPVLSEETCAFSDEEEILSDPGNDSERENEEYDEKELFGEINSDNEDCLF